MARDFIKTAGNYMRLGINQVGPLLNGAGAISLAAWIYPDSTSSIANGNRAVSIYVANGSTGLMLALHDGTAARVRIGARSQSGDSFQTKTGTTTVGTSGYSHVGGVIDIAGDTITPYYNGAAEGGGAVTFGAATWTNGTPTTSEDGIGSEGIGSDTQNQFDGRIGEVGIWNGDIGAAGFAALAKGFSPLLVRPELLVAYFPLLGNDSPERDRISGLSGTITGTVAKADHPRVYMPRSRQIGKYTYVAPGGSASVGRLINRGLVRGGLVGGRLV